MSEFRVLLVSHAYAVPFNRAKAEALAASGMADVTLLTPDRWNGRVPGEGENRPYRLIRLPIAFPGRGGGYFFLRGIKALVKRLGPDLVHVEEEPWSLAAHQFARLKKRFGYRYLLFSWENLRKDFRGPRRRIETGTLAAVDLGIGGNQEAAREMARKGVGTVHVLPQLGVDTGHFCADRRKRADRWTVGYAGRLVREKGVDRLLRAVARLNGPWRLRILGSGPEEAPLRNLAASLGISDRVEFLPGVPHEAVAPFFQTLHVFVLPSVTTPDWAEQFGHVLIEAMSAEVPVVASRSGSIPEVVGDAGFLFPEGDVAALGDILDRLRANPSLAEECGGKGRERVLARYSWERIAGQTLEIYRRVLETRSAPPGPGDEERS